MVLSGGKLSLIYNSYFRLFAMSIIGMEQSVSVNTQMGKVEDIVLNKDVLLKQQENKIK